MLTIELKKEIFARIKLPELELEARVVIYPKGDVEVCFSPWSQLNLTKESFEQMVEEMNLLKAHIRLAQENMDKEELRPPRTG